MERKRHVCQKPGRRHKNFFISRSRIFLIFSSPSSTATPQTLPPDYSPPPSELQLIQKAIRDAGANWVAGETSNSKLTGDERRNMLVMGAEPGFERPEGDVVEPPSLTASDLAMSLDYRLNGWVTSVKNQKPCSSCWAFATTAALESKVAMATGEHVDLAEQWLLSCGSNYFYHDGGICDDNKVTGYCGDGDNQAASNFLKYCGLTLEIYNPYKAVEDGSSCLLIDQCCPGLGATFRFFDYVIVASKNTANKEATWNRLKSALADYGPVVITMNVFNDFVNYRGGLYTHSTSLDYLGHHVVLLVGYNQPDNNQPETWYFIAKNSWGTDWGQEEDEPGYFRIKYSELYDGDGTDGLVYNPTTQNTEPSKVQFGKYAMAYLPLSPFLYESYPPFGTVAVTINPPDAVKAGAKWRIGQTTWQETGTILSGLLAHETWGVYTVQFADIAGWTTPQTQSVTLKNHLQREAIEVTYVRTPQTGTLTGTVEPEQARSAGAKWRLDGGDWIDSGKTISGIPVGLHTIEFKEIPGWAKPISQSVEISDGECKEIRGTYTRPLVPLLFLTLLSDGPTEQLITISEPVDGLVAVSGAAGSVQPNVQIQVTNNSTGDITIVGSGEDGSFSAQIPAQQGDVIVIAYVDSITQTDAIPRQAQSQAAPSNSSGFPEPPESPIISAFIVGGPLPPPMPPL